MTRTAKGLTLSSLFALGYFALVVVGAAMLVAGQDNSLYLAAG
ncbi:MAG: hypothetical protein AAGB25_02750 [Pseudomonadota bacterium]